MATSGIGLDDVVGACYARWAELEPDKATAAGFALPADYCKWYATRAAIDTWAEQDFSKAWAWLESSAPRSEWWAAGELAVRRMTKRDPQAALALLARTSEPEIRKRLPFIIANAWGAKDPEAALAWTQSLPEESERTILSGKVVEAAGEQNPARALTLLEKLDNASARGETGWNVLWYWALRAPDEAFAEMTKNGSTWPDRLAYGLGDAMARHDAKRAAEAARSMPEGPKRDEFVQGVLIGVSHTDPGAAVSIIELISDKELMSHGGLNSFIGAWARKDVTAAAQWIASLPEDTTHKKEFAASHFQAEAGRSWQDVVKEGGAK